MHTAFDTGFDFIKIIIFHFEHKIHSEITLQDRDTNRIGYRPNIIT